MSGWDSYVTSVRDLSAVGECVGAGIYGNDGSKWASTEGVNIMADEIQKARTWLDDKEGSDYTHGITLDGNPYTFLRHLEDSAGTMALKRKHREGETLNDKQMYQAFIAGSKTAVMVALFVGGKRGNETAGVKRMSDLIEYLKSNNM
ncbi:uncharacterized protein [Mytilus edulis]|uniref:uncharacterized protein n=1 Tax=Mytilus edulis TaxID=6550 RepID=UPI0039EDFC3D